MTRLIHITQRIFPFVGHPHTQWQCSGKVVASEEAACLQLAWHLCLYTIAIWWLANHILANDRKVMSHMYIGGHGPMISISPMISLLPHQCMIMSSTSSGLPSWSLRFLCSLGGPLNASTTHHGDFLHLVRSLSLWCLDCCLKKKSSSFQFTTSNSGFFLFFNYNLFAYCFINWRTKKKNK